MNIQVRGLLAVLLLAGFLHAAQPAAAASDTHHTHHADHQLVGVDAFAAAQVYAGEVERVAVYVKARADAEAFWTWVGQLAAFLPTLAPPPLPVPVQPDVPAVHASNGFHSDAWWHGVAVCEQGGRNDPFFGYFSFMDGSQGGRSWDDQVAAANSALANAVASTGSESPAWAPACVAAGYAASPSG